MSSKPFTRMLALLLACSMTLSLLSPAAFAAETAPAEDAPPAVTEVEQEEALPSEEEPAESIPEPSVGPQEVSPTETEPAAPTDDKNETETAVTEGAPADEAAQEVETTPSSETPQESPTDETPVLQPQSRKKTVWKVSRSARDTARFLNRHRLTKPKRSIRVDTKKNKVTVDGKTADPAEVFGEEAEEVGILDSTASAQAYLDETPFEVQSVQSGILTVTAPFQTCRLIVMAEQLTEDYGAAEILEYANYDEFFLQFDTEEETQGAYETLCQVYGEEAVIVDEVLWADELLMSVTHDEIDYPSKNVSSWGNGCMGTGTLKQMSFPDAPTVTVAVIDTGIDPDNWFFEGRTISEQSWNIPDNTKGTANMKDLAGSRTGHGTHVAGIVADGTPANVELLPIRIFNDGGSADYTDLIAAMDYAIEQGADVINLSVGGVFSSDYLKEQLDSARKKDIPVVCSAGNNDNVVYYPACSALTVAVSSLDDDHTLSIFSCYGDEVDFAAPGGSIASAKNGGSQGSYKTDSGTSMAAPHIAAAFACLETILPDKTYQEYYDTLKENCLDFGEEGRDKKYGWGLPKLFCNETSHILSAPYFNKDVFGSHCLLCHLFIPSDIKCGNHVTAHYENGRLSLSGTGKMYDYENAEDVPWYPIRDLISVLSIDEGVTAISKLAFYGCKNLKNPTIPASVTEIGVGAFAGCSSITAFTVDKKNPAYTASSTGLLTSKDGTVIHAFPAGYSVGGKSFLFQIAGNVTDIQPYAFSGSTYLLEVVFPASVTSIGSRAFEGCTQRMRIFFHGDYPSIAEDAFIGVKPSIVCRSAYAKNWPSSVSGFGAVTNDKEPKPFTNWRQYYPKITDCVITPQDANYPDYPYTGEPITPNLELVSNTSILKSYDYSLSYENNVEAGIASVTVTGKYAYEGKKTLNFHIIKNIALVSALSIPDQLYTGKAVTPLITLTDGKRELVEGTDYTLSYENNVDMGTASILISGMGDYSGTKTVKFAIRKDLSALPVAEIGTVYYDGAPATPAVTVNDEGYQLVEGTDYTLSYENNSTTGIATVVITGVGKYCGTQSVPFSLCKDLMYVSVTSVANQSYTGKAVTPSVTVTDGTYELVDGTDYTLSYENNVERGPAVIRIIGKGSYYGEITVPFLIRYSLSSLTVKPLSKVTFNNKAYTPDVVIMDGKTQLKKNVDYTLTYKNNKSAGTATVTANGKGRYEGTLSARFVIEKRGISSAATSISNVTYSGKALTPAPTVKYGSYTLKKATDYTVSYKNNVKIGTATVTLTGKGNWKGSVQKTFSILPKTTTVSSVSSKKAKNLTVKWKKNTSVTGYEVQVATNKAFTAGVKKKTVSKNKTVSTTFTGLKKKTSYYVRVRTYQKVGGKNFYSAWKVYSKSVKVK